MKQFLYAMLIAFMAFAFIGNSALGKDDAKIATVEYALTPAPHCQNCVNKIKGNLRFEKGVKAIDVDLKKKTVAIAYSPKATNPEKLAAALSKIGYQASPYQAECRADSCAVPACCE